MKIAALILASGKGTRMNDGRPAEIPKSLHLLDDKPMIDYIYETVIETGIDDIFVVIGYKGQLIKGHMGERAKYINQDKMRGTGEALMEALPFIEKYDKVLVINGDNPFFSVATIKDMLDIDAEITIASTITENPTGYGRVFKKGDKVIDIIEEKEATEEQKNIKEINAGCYVLKTYWLKEALKRLTLHSSGEFYITELPKIADEMGFSGKSYILKNHNESFGVNSKNDLKKANELIIKTVK